MENALPFSSIGKGNLMSIHSGRWRETVKFRSLFGEPDGGVESRFMMCSCGLARSLPLNKMSSESQVDLRSLPEGWKMFIKQVCKGIREDLGPRSPADATLRQELSVKVLQLDLMVYAVRPLQFWRSNLPDAMKDVEEMVRQVLPWATWWPRLLADFAQELREPEGLPCVQ
jgi:hypothetical protein